jgi:hypothetical protein
LPLRAYNLIWNEWFRDENLQNSVNVNKGDGPGTSGDYNLLKRAKRPDYFTTALPWTQKGGGNLNLFTGAQAVVKTNSTALFTGAQTPMQIQNATGAGNVTASALLMSGGTPPGVQFSTTTGTGSAGWYPSNLYADLSTATTFTINALRQSFQIQRLLERDARGGTRYTELVKAHFGVISPDARLQRPEYLGGGSTPINVSPIAQTSATGVTGGTAPLGTLSAFATGLAQGQGFVQSFTEHGYIIGLVNIRADVTYQQGLRRMWSRSTRYDFYFPAFAMLGEQAILNQEIYISGAAGTGAAQDQGVFGYQERWGDYRYFPSMITGQFRSTYATPLDAWHLAEKFTALPTLGSTFIQSNVPVSRVSAVNVAGSHFLFDSFFDVKVTRPMPMYSVPGMIDHF